jgi:Undecaprenyl-phosphate glucose phosphotransferase
MSSTPVADAMDSIEIGSPAGAPLLDPPFSPARRRNRLSRETLDLIPDALRLIDFVVLILSILYFYPLLRSTLPSDTWLAHFENITAGIVVTPFILQTLGLYGTRVLLSPGRTVMAVLWGFGLLALAMLGFCFATGTVDYPSLLWGGLWSTSSFVVFLTTRLALAQTIASLARRGVLSDSVAIVGGGSRADRLVAHLSTRHLWQPYRCPIGVVGIFDDRHNRLPAGCLTVGGTLDDLIALGKEGAFDSVILTLPWSAEQRLLEIRNKLQALAINVSLCPDGLEFPALSRGKFRVEDPPFYPLAERPLRRWNAVAKRCEDIVLASLALLFFGPLMVLVAVAVKLDSPGPALFRQRRHGFNNREIEVYKFRSMRHDMTDRSGALQARRGDSRITRLGSFLRRTSIDELPQLLNVWKGDMSLVGPRPHPVGMKTQDKFCHEIVATYFHRHRVKPGITGWAQVNGYRGATSEVDDLVKRVEYDLFYIENWSLLFDLKIMLKTVRSVLSTENAY